MDMGFGPDGALYVLDYGTGYSNNQALYRIEYIGQANRNPIAKASADKTSGPAPLTVNFSSAGSSDPEGGALTYSWDFGDGTTSTAANPTKTYTANGTYTATLTVRDPHGLTGSGERRRSTVGNTAPTVTLTTPADGQLFSFGDTVPFQVTVTDPEDGTIDCSKVDGDLLARPRQPRPPDHLPDGCCGTIAVPGRRRARRRGEHLRRLRRRLHRQGRPDLHQHPAHCSRGTGRPSTSALSRASQTADHASAEGGKTVGFIDNGDWISFQPYNLSNARASPRGCPRRARAAGSRCGRARPTGTLLGTVNVASTGGWETFVDVSANLSGAPAGATTLYLRLPRLDGPGLPVRPGRLHLRHRYDVLADADADAFR